jgi:hypothetical protein
VRSQTNLDGEIVNDFEPTLPPLVALPVAGVRVAEGRIGQQSVRKRDVVRVRLLTVMPEDVLTDVERDLPVVVGHFPALCEVGPRHRFAVLLIRM